MSQLVHPSTGRRATNIEDSRDIETCPNLCAAHCKGTDLSLTRDFVICLVNTDMFFSGSQYYKA